MVVSYRLIERNRVFQLEIDGEEYFWEIIALSQIIYRVLFMQSREFIW